TSALVAWAPALSGVSEGTRTIVLTVALSALAAALAPVGEEEGAGVAAAADACGPGAPTEADACAPGAPTEADAAAPTAPRREVRRAA
ncbi:MAG: hypothetical protein PUG35_06750, partial [Olsenella sp.]|nr:hypothetical protein [Olsenella sp.]